MLEQVNISKIVCVSEPCSRLERAAEAISDANTALEINKHSTKAIVAKGEALYSIGEFEKALVQFERGWRFRQDPAIKSGMVKCRDAIIITVGTTAKQYDEKMVEVENGWG